MRQSLEQAGTWAQAQFSALNINGIAAVGDKGAADRAVARLQSNQI